jgi:serine phosphatase RsbU (regulator of sigma subunit)
MMVGAARAIVKETRDPAEILTRLNRELAGHLKSGFATCICIKADRTGAVTVANAGHLPPWINSVEVAMAGTLPLGIMAETQYIAQDLQLRDGDTLMLLSDGVVEARREKDGTLFGFSRLGELFATNPSAESIAREAQRFGQEDDISVLSIRRLRKEKPSAASMQREAEFEDSPLSPSRS